MLNLMRRNRYARLDLPRRLGGTRTALANERQFWNETMRDGFGVVRTYPHLRVPPHLLP